MSTLTTFVPDRLENNRFGNNVRPRFATTVVLIPISWFNNLMVTVVLANDRLAEMIGLLNSLGLRKKGGGQKSEE